VDNNLEKILVDVLTNAYSRLIFSEERLIKDMIGDNSLSLKEFQALDVIHGLKASGNNTAGNVAKILGITISTCTINIDRLIAKGYVNKVKNDSDRRVAYLDLTDKGKQVRLKREQMHKRKITSALEKLTMSEKVTLMNAINKLDI
jgi:DNA-binding MarR family transcriptional regulator